jgi:hypothetical protein
LKVRYCNRLQNVVVRKECNHAGCKDSHRKNTTKNDATAGYIEAWKWRHKNASIYVVQQDTCSVRFSS